MKPKQSILGAVLALCLLALSHVAGAQDGVSKSTIVLGQSVALSGPASSLGQAFAQGAKLHFDRVNAEGGVHGRTINLVTLDDAGTPAKTLENTKKLLAQGVLSLFGYYGSPQLTAAYPALKNSDVLLFAPMAAADEFRGAMYPNVYSLRPGYSEEAAAITRHAETLGARKLVILHSDDGESMAALESAERTMTSLGADLLLKAPLGSVDKALQVQPQSVLVISDPKGAASAIRTLRDKGFRGPVYGFSNTGESLLADLLGPVGAGVVVTRVVPKSDNLKVAVVRELQADMAAAKLGKSNVYLLEGYTAARIFVAGLRAAGKDPTRAKLKKAFDSMADVSVGDFRVHFAGDRVASKMVQLGVIDAQGRVRD
ncbi:MAG: ABC transporter substrate-binding protein [Rhodoferax sp.]|nr:ABC transporter substrate-binding protein [Rhodoferax sp.]